MAAGDRRVVVVHAVPPRSAARSEAAAALLLRVAAPGECVLNVSSLVAGRRGWRPEWPEPELGSGRSRREWARRGRRATKQRTASRRSRRTPPPAGTEEEQIGDRLQARAALTGEPSTRISASEAAWVLGFEPSRQPKLDGHNLAPWSAWLGVLDAPGPLVEDMKPAEGPITTWRRVAEVLGVSHDTVSRLRTARGDRRRPWFATADTVREWWAALQVEPTPTPPTRAQRSQTQPAEPRGKTLADLRRK